MDLVSPIIDLWNCIMVPTCNHVEQHRVLGEMMDDLRTKLRELQSRKEDIETKKQTEVCSDKEVAKVVEQWLERAEVIITEIQKVEEKFQNVKFMCRGCLSKRVQKKIDDVDKFLEKGNFPEGIVIDKPPARGMILPTDQHADAEGGHNKVKFREHLEEKILEYLMGDDVGMVGICGAGGIGKTTIAKSINNKMSNLMDSKFDKVLWAFLPYPFSIFKLQDTIASAMKDKLPENGGEEERAAKLFEIMGKIKFLLILDDAWERFSFEHVGIPVPTAANGCKVVITSRSTQVCRYIGCNDDGLVEVKTLSEKESLNLLLDTVGRDVIMKTPGLEEISRDLAKECAGLPLAIVVIAKSMRGERDISGWRNALHELRNCVESVNGWDDEIFKRLKFSYHRLKDEEFQSCFLFCSLYRKSEQIERKQLIECWVDGGLIKQMKTRKEMVDRAKAILNRLISDFLIEEAKDSYFYGLRRKCVRMHDVVRDMALRVASSGFMVKAGEKLTVITENEEWPEHLEKVSMIDSGIQEISPDFCPKCPKLSTLLLSWNRDLRVIPDSFFKGIPNLTYLNLCNTSISALPDSVSYLINLTSLELRHIEELKYVPSLAGLKALKKLDLYRAGIKVVPEGIEVLVNLQHLDLRCPNLVEFPTQILKDLSRLEFFAINALSCWSTTDVMIKEKQVPSRLQMLETFMGGFYNLEGLADYVKFFHQAQKLTQYFLLVGDKYRVELRGLFGDIAEFSKKLILDYLNIRGNYLVLLPYDLQELEIMHCHGVESLSETSLLNTKTDVRSCKIASCSFQCIIDLGLPSTSSADSLFDKCEVLYIQYMWDLLELVKEAPHASSTHPSMFSNLKKFEMDNCQSMKKLFSSNLLKGLQNLEDIHVSDCYAIEAIIEGEEDKETLLTEGKTEAVTFSFFKLRKLVLKSLPRLKSICTARGVMVCDSIQVIEIVRCPQLTRIPLHLPLCSPHPSLQEIRMESIVRWELLEWDNPTTKEILLPFLKTASDASSLTWKFDSLQKFNSFVEHFQNEHLNSYEYTVKAINNDDDEADSYDHYVYQYYNKLVEICGSSSKKTILFGVQINRDEIVLLPDDIQCLEILKCRGMQSLCEFKTAEMNLKSCLIKQCGELECMVDLLSSSSVCNLLDGLPNMMLSKLPNLEHLVRMENQATMSPSTWSALTPSLIFSNLKHFFMHECPRIKKLFPSECLNGLQNLQKIFIFDCVEMEEIIQGEGDEETLKEKEGKNKTTTFSLPKLKELGLVKLPKLKSICTARAVIACASLEKFVIDECEMLMRIPLDLPQLPDGQLSPPPLLKEIVTNSTEWWESLVWDEPSAKIILDTFLEVN